MFVSLVQQEHNSCDYGDNNYHTSYRAYRHLAVTPATLAAGFGACLRRLSIGFFHFLIKVLLIRELSMLLYLLELHDGIGDVAFSIDERLLCSVFIDPSLLHHHLDVVVGYINLDFFVS